MHIDFENTSVHSWNKISRKKQRLNIFVQEDKSCGGDK